MHNMGFTYINKLFPAFPDIHYFVKIFEGRETTRAHYAEPLKLSECCDYWTKEREGVYS